MLTVTQLTVSLDRRAHGLAARGHGRTIVTGGCAMHGALQLGDLTRVRALRDVARLLEEPGLVAQTERGLLAEPGFARRYAQRTCPRAAASAAPPGSLAAAVRSFRAFYELGPDFFPAEPAPNAGPLAYAAWVLACDHDAYHVLCAYETSDHDEVALQSLLCAQAPCVFGAFVANLLRCPELAIRRYKHLRDLLDSDLDREAARRGQRACPLLSCDCVALCHEPLTRLRTALRIAPRSRRPTPAELVNSCGGKRREAFFEQDVGANCRPLPDA